MVRPIYVNIASATTTTLITKGGDYSGDIRKITIANKATATSNEILLELYDESSIAYTIARTDMPPKTSLVLTDNIGFNSSRYSLRITTSSVADITVIIK